MLMKYSSALLAVVISTMMGSTNAVKIEEETGLLDPYDVADTIFKISDLNEDGNLTKPEYDKAIEKLIRSVGDEFEKF